MSRESDFKLSAETRATLKTFANFSPFIEVLPSGRSFISYRKSMGLYCKLSVEVWLDLKLRNSAAVNLAGLLNGQIQFAEIDSIRDTSWMNYTGKRFVGKPITSFALDAFDITILKSYGSIKERRIVRLDRNRPAGSKIDDVSELTELSISEFDGLPCQFSFHSELRRKLPTGDYWVKLFPTNVASFENIDRGFTFLSVMGEIEPIASEANVSN